MRSLLLHLMLVVLLAGTARAASIYVEPFPTSDAGWVSRDPLELEVDFTNSFGNAAGSLAGYFESQITASPESDAFRADASASGGAFAGNYWAISGGFSAWNFSLYADDVLPSDLQIRFSDGTSTFFRILTPQLTAVDSWMSFNAPLTSFAGWIGPGATAFSNALGSVQFVDVQVARNGIGAQTYYLDNFALLGNTMAVPEPGSALMLLVGVGLLRAARGRRLLQRMLRREGVAVPRQPAPPSTPAPIEVFNAPRRRSRRRRPSDAY